MDVTLIVNPFASGVSQPRVRVVEHELGHVAQVRTLLTERPGHAVELAAAVEADAVVVFSGDGGVNEVLNGLRDGTPLGVLPGGGTNVLARALGLSRHPEQAAREVANALQAARTRTISVGRVNGRRFGFGGKLCIHPNQVRISNGVFRPTDEEIEWARSILAERDARPADAVFSHRGALVDRPVIERATQIVTLAQSVTNRS